MTPRDRDLERDYLGAAAEISAPPAGSTASSDALFRLYDADGFVAAALARLDQHGPSVTPRSPAEILAELQEEAADGGGWAACALAACPEADRVAFIGAIAPAVGLFARAWAHLEAVRTAQEAKP